MKRFHHRLIGPVFSGMICLGLLAAASAADDEMTVRTLVRRYAKDKNATELKNVTGLDVKHVLALEHTILITRDGREESVLDPEKRQFTLGDQIRVRIRSLTDAYLYIFYEGAGGERKCLLPDKEEKAPFVKAGETVDLPADGTFEFIAPPGKELLRVVATEKSTADLAGLLNVVFNKPDLTPQEEDLKKAIRAKIEARLQSISSQQAQTMTYRGLLTKDALEAFRGKVEESGSSEIVLRELPGGNHDSTFTMVAGAKPIARPLLVTIPLQSVRSTKP
jgi:hypothetical protein